MDKRKKTNKNKEKNNNLFHKMLFSDNQNDYGFFYDIESNHEIPENKIFYLHYFDPPEKTKKDLYKKEKDKISFICLTIYTFTSLVCVYLILV
jgi:hypothetical protein